MSIAPDHTPSASCETPALRKPLREKLFLLIAATWFLCGPSLAQTCHVDTTAVKKRIADLEKYYPLVLSDIGCDLPRLKAHQLMCDASWDPQSNLWTMGRLDDLAWVYAYENATKTKFDYDNPSLDLDFIAKRDACTDIICLCTVLQAHTNDSLGGTSPYEEP